MSDFKPSYTWPASIPFRMFFQSDEVRVFIIENVQHNWNWLSECAEHIRPTDYFFVIGGWYQSEAFADEAQQIFSVLGLRKQNFFMMYNSLKEQKNFEKYGFMGELINQNAWLKEKRFGVTGAAKKFDAVYVGRRSAFKRHMLAEKVKSLAIISGDNHGNAISPVPAHAWTNPQKFTPAEVHQALNEARCGLLLSALEGACFASSEYLLCGLPVVSTPSLGGRDVWYNEYNAIIAEPNPDAIAAAVDEFVSNPRDPQRIIQMHINQAEVYRKRFVENFGSILKRHGHGDMDANLYFRQNFTPKMRGGMSCDEIVKIFKGN